MEGRFRKLNTKVRIQNVRNIKISSGGVISNNYFRVFFFIMFDLLF